MSVQGIPGFPCLNWGNRPLLFEAIRSYPRLSLEVMLANDGVRCKAEVIQAAGYSPLMELLPARARETDREETGHYTTLY